MSKLLDFKPQAIFFDMDSTLVAEETLVEMADEVGLREKVEEVTLRAMNGQIDFETSLRCRVALFSGVTTAVIDKVIGRMTFNPGALELAQYCREQGIDLFVVSGGFIPMVGSVAQNIFAKDYHANQLEVKNQKLTGQLVGTVVDAHQKKVWFEKTCEHYGYDKNKTIAIGDGANDVPLLKAANYAIGFNPKPILKEIVDWHIDDFRILKERLTKLS